MNLKLLNVSSNNLFKENFFLLKSNFYFFFLTSHSQLLSKLNKTKFFNSFFQKNIYVKYFFSFFKYFFTLFFKHFNNLTINQFKLFLLIFFSKFILKNRINNCLDIKKNFYLKIFFNKIKKKKYLNILNNSIFLTGITYMKYEGFIIPFVSKKIDGLLGWFKSRWRVR